MFSHLTIKVTMMFLTAVVLVNLANYIFYVYYNPSAEGLPVVPRPIATPRSKPEVISTPENVIRSKYLSNDNVSKLCPAIPPGLGPVSANRTMFNVPSEKSYSPPVFGGFNKVTFCVSRERAAVIVPIPPTADYPFEFINYIHSFLRKQMLEYQLFVVKQSFASSYHRGRLINAAYSTLHKVLHKSFNCIIVHDPAILPTDTRNIYRCSWYPRQLVATLNKDDKVSSYESTFGGAIAISRDQFIKVNGFSNVHEDNGIFMDLARRLTAVNYIIERTPPIIGNYITLKTTEISIEIESSTAQNPLQSSLKDGLTSVSYLFEMYEQRDTFSYLQISLPDNRPSSMLPVQSNAQE